MLQTTILPRQARDGQSKRAERDTAFCAGKITGLHNWIQYYIEETKGAKNASFWRHFYVKTILLPRQTRDRHREGRALKNVAVFSQTGLLLVHPLYWDWPEEQAAYALSEFGTSFSGHR